MNSTSTESIWVKIPQPAPNARLRLFCFPYAGGSTSVFRSWIDWLPPNIELCLVELPGRGPRLYEKPFTQMQALVQAIAPNILPFLDKPYAFFGHSMGALLSFELARSLRRYYSSTPLHLFISAHRAPQIPNKKDPIHNLSEPKFVDRLRHLNGTPKDILEHAELMQLLMPTLRADFTIVDTYRYIPEELLSCPITVFGGLHDHEVDYEDLEAWQQQTQYTFSLVMLPGDHFFITHSMSFNQYLIEQLISY